MEHISFWFMLMMFVYWVEADMLEGETHKL
jgi:hypothetical protein